MQRLSNHCHENLVRRRIERAIENVSHRLAYLQLPRAFDKMREIWILTKHETGCKTCNGCACPKIFLPEMMLDTLRIAKNRIGAKYGTSDLLNLAKTDIFGTFQKAATAWRKLLEIKSGKAFLIELETLYPTVSFILHLLHLIVKYRKNCARM